VNAIAVCINSSGTMEGSTVSFYFNSTIRREFTHMPFQTLMRHREERRERGESNERRGTGSFPGRLAFSVNGGVIMGHFAKKN